MLGCNKGMLLGTSQALGDGLGDEFDEGYCFCDANME